MKETIDILRNTDIISKDNVIKLRKYIIKKYPEYDHKNQIKAFADSVHKILNTSLMPFSENERKKIKQNVLANAVNKKEFSISAYDVFRQCIIENSGDTEYCKNIETWLNAQGNICINPSELKMFLDNVWRQPKNNIDETINNAAEFSGNTEAKGNAETDNGIKEAEEQDAALQDDLKQNGIKEENSEITNGFRHKAYENSSMGLFSHMQPIFIFYRAFTLKSKDVLNNISELMILFRKHRKAAAICSASILVLIFLIPFGINFAFNNRQRLVSSDNEIIPNGDMGIVDGLSSEFKYKEINKSDLKKWLDGKNSILSDDKYLIPIIDASKEFNVNPFLLIAITGQEQAFVPRNEKNAEKIANNPFNVYGSWQDYNTNINDSARLAARTIVDSSNGRPVNADELEWVNRKYSQDPKWWIGVTKIFYQIKKDIENK